MFAPIKIRDVTFTNRIWLAPMCQYSCVDQDGMPGEHHFVHLGARAMGGFGLLITEATAITPVGRISAEDTGLWNDDHTEAWARINDFCRPYTKTAVQLAHAGRKASTHPALPGHPAGSLPPDSAWPTFAPSAVAFPGLADPVAMTRADIAQVTVDFADAARRACDAGFDAIEIHAAHGYLLHQFLSPLSNHRDDEYGGDLACRTRLVREVVSAVRAVVPETMPVFVRISATDWTDGGWTLEDSVELAIWLRDLGVDLIDVSTGGNVMADIPVGPNYQVPFAATIKREAQVATAAVGLIRDASTAQSIVAEGSADAVLIGRAALLDAALPQRFSRDLGQGAASVGYPAQYARAVPA